MAEEAEQARLAAEKAAKAEIQMGESVEVVQVPSEKPV